MRRSKFSEERRRKIILEKENDDLTVQEICNRYKISINTYYLWKRTLFPESDKKEFLTIESPGTNLNESDSRDFENKTLRRLYINLSAHNYELAKFLEK